MISYLYSSMNVQGDSREAHMQRRRDLKCAAGLAAAMLQAANAFTAPLAIRALRSPCAVPGLRMQAPADTLAAHRTTLGQCVMLALAKREEESRLKTIC